MLVEAQDVHALLDTNVMMDIYASANLVEATEAHATDQNNPIAVYRRARVRESLLLAILFHERKAITVGLHSEGIEQLLRLAHPEDLTSFNTGYSYLFIHFVKDHLLSGWHHGFEKGRDSGLTGAGRDRLLLDLALTNGLPLITNEGYGPSGIDEDNGRSLRVRSREAGVHVYTPREFWRGKLNEVRAAKRFLDEFNDKMPRYLAELRTKQGRENTEKTASTVHALYQYVLFGITSVPGQRVRVALDEE